MAKEAPNMKRKPPEGENAGLDSRAKSQSQQITDRLNKGKKKQKEEPERDGKDGGKD